MSRPKADDGIASSILPRLALAVMRAWRNPRIGRHIFDQQHHPYFGSVWFGARRPIIAELVDLFESHEIQAYFSQLWIADEFLVPTLLMRAAVRHGPSHHFVNTFIDANPAWFGESDYERLRRSPAYFARKFRDDPADPIRRRVLKELAASTAIEPTVASRA